MTKTKKEPIKYVSMKMKPEEHQMVVLAKETLKMYGLVKLHNQIGILPTGKDFNFTDGEVCMMGCVILMSALNGDIKKNTEKQKEKKKGK
jgi:hypothetical protein